MSPLLFNMTVMESLADHRTALLTKFFLGVTSFGTFNVYVLIITLIYVAWNKQLAIRLSVLLLVTASLDGLLKLTIRNPRPFVSDGTYLKKWAVSPETARGLATEYSTPSGHAMSAAAFYSYLFAAMKNGYVRVAAVLAIVLVGLSRSYLGVHYVEDVLLGWVLGLGCALVSIRYAGAVGDLWNKLSYGAQIGIAVMGSVALWVLALAVSGGHVGGESVGFLADGGFLTGIVIARPLELRNLNFDPGSSHFVAKGLRCFLTIGLVIGTVEILGMAFGGVSSGSAVLGIVLLYVRFTAAGVVNIFLAPLLFTRIGLARRMRAAVD